MLPLPSGERVGVRGLSGRTKGILHMRVKDQVVVITGAATGIGYGCAQRFAAEGARVVLSDIDQAKGEEAAERLQGEGAEAVFVACEAGDKAQVKALVESAVAAFGRLEVLVANAGIGKVDDVRGLSEGWEEGGG